MDFWGAAAKRGGYATTFSAEPTSAVTGASRSCALRRPNQFACGFWDADSSVADSWTAGLCIKIVAQS
jgi:hypothetical protein